MDYESMIYLPVSKNSYACFVFQNSETIRAYKTMPTNNTQVEYNDFYINSHYLTNSGVQNFSQYTTIPTCIDKGRITDVYGYRNDISDIVIVVFAICLFCGFILKCFFKQLFRGSH